MAWVAARCCWAHPWPASVRSIARPSPCGCWLPTARWCWSAPAANAARRLLPLVCWLANHLAQRGHALQAGQTVTTGSWTGQRPWGEAREWRAEFAGIGEIVVRPQRQRDSNEKETTC